MAGWIDVAVGAAGLLLVLFLPGFLLVRAIAPRPREPASDLALAVVASLAITVLVGSALGFAGRFTRDALVLSLAAVATLAAVAAFARRGRAAPPLTHGPEAEEMERLAELAARGEGGEEARRLAERLDARREGR